MNQSQEQIVGIVEKVVLRNPIVNFLNGLITKIPLFSDLSSHLGSMFLKSAPISWQKIFFLTGATALTLSSVFYLRKLAIWSSIFISHQVSHSKLSAQLIKQKYGDCWVAITGFTEGIGWAFVQQLLKLNMKLVLIGRNKQKIQKRVQVLMQKFPHAQIQVILGDLSKAQDINEICRQLQDLSQIIDIGVLINNAGISGLGQFFKNTPQSILDISVTNWTSVIKLNSVMVPIMRDRKQRSAIVNISSCTGRFISGYLSTYPASKRMVNVYSQFLRKENQNKIDVLLAMPFGVTTPMMKMTKNYATITPQVCAKSIISDLLSGNFVTHGGLPHKFFGKIFEEKSQEQCAQRLQKFWKKFA